LIDQGGEVAFGGERMREAMDSLGAHAMAVHLNFLQEVVQPEGDTQARGCLEAIRELAAEVPVMAKETGAGISNETARRLKGAGVVAIDVSGMGGTSFAKVERYRAERVGSSRGARLGQTFGEWGIPAPVSLIWSRVGLPLVASGGVTSGLDMARAMAMGASCTGLAGAILQDALESADRVVETLETFREELRAAMFLTGSSDLDQLSRGRYVVMGRTREWLDSEVF
ncbi:MAG: alpha-hydroxy-acid oxidizing protein, partial [Thermoplasmatota archaeon]